MTLEGKINRAFEKADLYDRRRRNTDRYDEIDQHKKDRVKKMFIGELLIRHFPELHDYDPSIATEEASAALERFFESVAESQRCGQELEDHIFKAFDV